jgi:hypothetical protein
MCVLASCMRRVGVSCTTVLAEMPCAPALSGTPAVCAPPHHLQTRHPVSKEGSVGGCLAQLRGHWKPGTVTGWEAARTLPYASWAAAKRRKGPGQSSLPCTHSATHSSRRIGSAAIAELQRRSLPVPLRRRLAAPLTSRAPWAQHKPVAAQQGTAARADREAHSTAEMRPASALLALMGALAASCES